MSLPADSAGPHPAARSGGRMSRLERIAIGRHTRHASGTHERGSGRLSQTSPTRERGSVGRSVRPIRPPPTSPTRERRSGVAHRARMRPGRTRTDRPSLARRAGIEPARQGVRNPFVMRSRNGTDDPPRSKRPVRQCARPGVPSLRVMTSSMTSRSLPSGPMLNWRWTIFEPPASIRLTVRDGGGPCP